MGAVVSPLARDPRQQGEAICARLAMEIHKLGFAPERVLSTPVYQRACLETQTDPFSGEESLCGYWRDDRGRLIGQFKFHSDGSFYAEYDIVLPHPNDSRWFVEGVIAWGRADLIKSEAKLLPMPD